ncbi:Conjugative transfer protein TrbI [Candidatus Burkholderia verschuerenii]|uniref:Conjugative transfer protein TrbI n=1 Tax=Candidatus Burkholderia verschuerenii TaxID=242163 RepID=A0A0L0M9V8_9BURK|nr:Conjugative transfer protein TrbI [Candidatus Burkholderia verschuerenii]
MNPENDQPPPEAGPPKIAPEAVALRAQPRQVMRLNRRTLALLSGGLGIAVLGAALWSLQPHRHIGNEATELYSRACKIEFAGMDPTTQSGADVNAHLSQVCSARVEVEA